MSHIFTFSDKFRDMSRLLTSSSLKKQVLAGTAIAEVKKTQACQLYRVGGDFICITIGCAKAVKIAWGFNRT
jgi:hypothetical protein